MSTKRARLGDRCSIKTKDGPLPAIVVNLEEGKWIILRVFKPGRDNRSVQLHRYGWDSPEWKRDGLVEARFKEQRNRESKEKVLFEQERAEELRELERSVVSWELPRQKRELFREWKKEKENPTNQNHKPKPPQKPIERPPIPYSEHTIFTEELSQKKRLKPSGYKAYRDPRDPYLKSCRYRWRTYDNLEISNNDYIEDSHLPQYLADIDNDDELLNWADDGEPVVQEEPQNGTKKKRNVPSVVSSDVVSNFSEWENNSDVSSFVGSCYSEDHSLCEICMFNYYPAQDHPEDVSQFATPSMLADSLITEELKVFQQPTRFAQRDVYLRKATTVSRYYETSVAQEVWDEDGVLVSWKEFETLESSSQTDNESILSSNSAYSVSFW
jgi:hypothetical protein